MRHAAISAFGAMLTLSGCSSNSQQKLALEIDRLLRPGNSVISGLAALKSDGFICSKNTPSPYDPSWSRADVVCERDRNYYVVATCVQRVFVSVHWAAGRIASLDVPRPVCFGL